MIVKLQALLLCSFLLPATVYGDWRVRRRRTDATTTDHGQPKKIAEPAGPAEKSTQTVVTTSNFVVVPGPQSRTPPPARPYSSSSNSGPTTKTIITHSNKTEHTDSQATALADTSSSCAWVAWTQTCRKAGVQGRTNYPSELIVAHGYDEWIDTLYEQGDQGRHLMKAAVDADNDLYFGYFQQISAYYGWISTSNWTEFEAFYDSNLEYDYDVTAMFFAQGNYFLWLKHQPSTGAAYYGTYDLAAFKENMSEMANQGYFLTAVLLDDEDPYGDYWLGWYQHIHGIRYWHPWRWSHIPSSFEELTDDFNEKVEGEAYIGGTFFPTTLLQNSDGSWLVWYELDWFEANSWATRSNPNDMTAWIDEQQNQYGRCLTALAHGCD